jgi:four helix bundle protein
MIRDRKLKSVVYQKAFSFSVKIISQYKQLINGKEFILSKQLLKSGTSIGANISEAIAAYTKPDFRAKFSIALKEASETEYWLELLYVTNFLRKKEFEELYLEVTELNKIIS